MGPPGKIGERYIDAAIFGCASLQGANCVQPNGATLKAEVERLALADNVDGADANQCIVRSLRPAGHRPPGAVQLLRLFEIRSGYDHRMTIRSASYRIGEGNCDSTAA